MPASPQGPSARIAIAVALMVAAIVAAPLTPASALTTETRWVSVHPGQAQNGTSLYDSSPISADGRFVAFQSEARSIVPNDMNLRGDVFVRDLVTLTTTRVSVSSDGDEADDASYFPAISSDGRFVAFESVATNLVPDDTNGGSDVFVHDRTTKTTMRVSVSSDGAQGTLASYAPTISADGRFVAFESGATNLVPNDTNQMADVFVHDLVTHTTSRVSVNSEGEQTDNRVIGDPAISANGRFVAFWSDAPTLVPKDTNDAPDVFVHDLRAGKTRMVSINSGGEHGNSNSLHPAISANGRFVAFESWATNLVRNDTNGETDVFVRDRKTRTTRRVSLRFDGDQAEDGSYTPAISAHGRFVAFVSFAETVVPNDTNGRGDVFVRDRTTHMTTRVNISSDGDQLEDASTLNPAISADGRFVTFETDAAAVPGDTNDADDVYVRGPLS